MGEIRKDLVHDEWVVVNIDRVVKPRDLPVPRQGHTETMPGFCPFCQGNEGVTPPELLALRPPDSPANSSGWDIRVIPNKFTAYSLLTDYAEEETGLNQMRTGFGDHEVIIESAEHGVEFHHHSVERICSVLKVVQSRFNSLASDDRIKHIQIYKNRGIFAGASLHHSHLQIISLPYNTNQYQGAENYHTRTGNCLWCDILKQEKQLGARIVREENGFTVLTPYASRFSYETWIVPDEHQADISKLGAEELYHLATLMHKTTNLLVEQLDNPSYNIVFNNGPVNVPGRAPYHWYIEIFPRLIVQAGVEIATGMYMNPISPEWAAENLRERW
ncbi:MAG: DUF4931 domain-containing protein [Methylocystaceae bacterium]